MQTGNLDFRKRILVSLIVATWLPVLIFLDYTKIAPDINITAFIARFCGITGTVVLFWQYILAARGLIGKVIPDMVWVTKIHRMFGKWGVLLIIIHFICISIFYAAARGINLISFTFDRPESLFKNVGMSALLVIIVIALSSITLRKYLTYRGWHRIHMFAYIILPISLIHNIGIGRMDLAVPARGYWIAMAVIYVLLFIYMALFSKGFFKSRYNVELVDREAVKVVNIRMRPLQRKLNPLPGQYIYMQRLGNVESHPFSVSDFDPVSGLITIAPKALGKFSDAIQSMEVGEDVLIDGPYGVFTSEVLTTERKVVFLAGGIGIVPFMPMIFNLGRGMNKEITLFYGNNCDAEVAFKSEIENVLYKTDNLKAIHVLKDNDSSDPRCETGFITKELLIKHLGDLSQCDFFVCGPEIMINAMKKTLEESNVSSDQIYYELFSN